MLFETELPEAESAKEQFFFELHIQLQLVFVVCFQAVLRGAEQDFPAAGFDAVQLAEKQAFFVGGRCEVKVSR